MINSKNKNFVPVEYENISFLKEPGVALVNEEDEKNIRGQGIK